MHAVFVYRNDFKCLMKPKGKEIVEFLVDVELSKAIRNVL